MTDHATLAAALAAVVRSTPGVETLYPSAPAVQAMVGALVGKVVEIITPNNNDLVSPDAHVTVSGGQGGVSVEARIGVAEAESASLVSRRVYDAIRDHISAEGDLTVGVISVTVARIG